VDNSVGGLGGLFKGATTGKCSSCCWPIVTKGHSRSISERGRVSEASSSSSSNRSSSSSSSSSSVVDKCSSRMLCSNSSLQEVGIAIKS
jgi:hypothetical protein